MTGRATTVESAASGTNVRPAARSDAVTTGATRYTPGVTMKQKPPPPSDCARCVDDEAAAVSVTARLAAKRDPVINASQEAR
jgi:hypothetical protein